MKKQYRFPPFHISITILNAFTLTFFYLINLYSIPITPTLNEKKADLILPSIYFEKNEGQIDADIKYLTKGPDYTLYFSHREILMVLHANQTSSTLKMQFVDANPQVELKGEQELNSKSHYFLGNDPNQWHAHIPNYAQISYPNLYPGIDAIFYGTPHHLEYDICVAPGKDPTQARLHLEGAEKISIDHQGNLQIVLANQTELSMLKPFVYQMLNNIKTPIEAQYILLANNDIGFKVGQYHQDSPLVIDPVLVYSSYLGGSKGNFAYDMTTDHQGYIYITGKTNSEDFPTTLPFSSPSLGNSCVFVTKLDPTGTHLIYSTYLGGKHQNCANGIAVDEKGNAYIVGQTNSNDFPTLNAYQPNFKGSFSAFITKLDSTGSQLLYSTYLGGNRNDCATGVAVDGNEHVYVVGQTSSRDFPTFNAYQSNFKGMLGTFVTKLDTTKSDLIYSTYLAGNNQDFGSSITIDNLGNAYVTGFTSSRDFPVVNPLQYSLKGINNIFITKINSTGNDLIYSTYLGGSKADFGLGIDIDRNHNVYITGQTNSSDFPIANAYQSKFSGANNALITKLDASGSHLIYSTYLGGDYSDGGLSIAVDEEENAYITGYTTSPNFPLMNPNQSTLDGKTNAFMSVLDATGLKLSHSTYLGGNGQDIGRAIALDPQRNVCVVGQTTSHNFPTLNAYQTSPQGSVDIFISKFKIEKK